MALQNYIILDIGKVVVEIEKDGKRFYKEVDDKLYELNEEELKKVEGIFENKNGYIWNSEELKILLNRNQELTQKEKIYPLLEILEEKIIPENCKSNFYRNIQTLRIEVPCKKKTSVSDSYGAEYNSTENKIKIFEDMLEHFYKEASKRSNPEECFEDMFNNTLLHELVHMASSYYDEKTGILLIGFDKFPANSEEDKNHGLTEGWTQAIANVGVDSINGSYYIESLLSLQLSDIVGVDIMMESFFKNKGVKLIKQKLNEIMEQKELSEALLNFIECNHYVERQNIAQTFLGNAQNIMVLYLETKLINDYLNKKITLDEINEQILWFESHLVTPEKLILAQKKPQKYINLQKSVDEFYKFKENPMAIIEDILGWSK